jgi:asparagine synthase (glutamine-hydrolysing)
MCGITGAAVVRGSADAGGVAAARDSIAHRGPDDAGLYVSPDGRVALGSRRLSIIDLSAAANQPLANEERSVWLVFNGEVFNFRELRTQLERRGHRFGSNTDSEVVVHLYEDDLEAATDRLRGMFGFAIWDEPRSRLTLARDRLGIKPVYYSWDGRRFLFASELKALMALLGPSVQIDHEGLSDYLACGYVPFDGCLVAGVRKLPAGHRLTLDLDAAELRIQQYWDVEYTGAISDPDEAAESVRDILDRAVEEQLVADVPLGLFLSGGLDSTSVLAAMTGRVSGPVRTFGIGFDARPGADLEYSRAMAAEYGTSHREHLIEIGEARSLLPMLGDLFDEPLGDYSTIPTYWVSKLARETAVVALSGDGGDELFGGYHWHVAELAARHRRERIVGTLPFVPAMAAAMLPLARRLPFLARATVLERVLYSRPEQGHFRTVGLFDAWEQQRLLGREAAAAIRGRDTLSAFTRFYRSDYPPLAALRYMDLKTYLVDDILVKVDRASMACSLEVRPPFLDHRLVELAFSIDDALLMGQAGGKLVLRRAVEGRVPQAVLARSKRGFGSPMQLWLRQGLVAGMLDSIEQWKTVNAGLIRPDFVRAFMRNRSFNRWAKLWALIVLEQWYGRWFDR